MYQPPARTGKRKGRIAAYYAGAYLRNKLRRIVRRNGLEAANAWADRHTCKGLLQSLRG